MPAAHASPVEPLLVLAVHDQDHLLHASDAALRVADAAQFCRWSRGPLQALLPHQVLVGLHFDIEDNLLHMECQHQPGLAPAVLAGLLDSRDGLVMALARHCRDRTGLPAMLDAAPGQGGVVAGAASAPAPAGCAAGMGTGGLSAFRSALRASGFDNLLIHGTGRLPGGASVFIVFGLAQRPQSRHAYLLAMLLPPLHLMLQRLTQRSTAVHGGVAALARPPSARECEILHWVREGKSNDEIGQILGISGLTVKNHLQRLYRLLGVSNRAHAIARGAALRLFDRQPLALARAA